MFDGNDNDKPGIEERYATSVGSSNLRVGNDPDIRTPGDLIAAAGMNKHRMGLALRRLMTEWDKSARPQPMTAAQVEALARTLATEPSTSPHAGFVRQETRDGVTYRLPLVVAQEQAAAWHAHELGLVFMALKTLPAVRSALVVVAKEREWADPGAGVHLVAAVLEWWLHPTCPTCSGRKLKVVAGTGRTGSKACKGCKPSPDATEGTGERKVPHGWQGRKLLAYMNECRTAAARELSEGNFAHHRKPKG